MLTCQTQSAHIEQLAIKRPSLCARLQRFSAGDSDTGHGGSVTNEAAFTKFIERCPSLKVVRLEAFTRLTDKTLLAILQTCKGIEKIHLSGNDKIPGGLKGTALQTLGDQPSLAPSLRCLELWDQPYELRKIIKVVSKARPNLWIHTGDTLGDSLADVSDSFFYSDSLLRAIQNVVAAMSGDVSTYTWLGGKIIHTDTDMGSYGPGGYDLPMEHDRWSFY